jgi:hypothetical protein
MGRVSRAKQWYGVEVSGRADADGYSRVGDPWSCWLGPPRSFSQCSLLQSRIHCIPTQSVITPLPNIRMTTLAIPLSWIAVLGLDSDLKGSTAVHLIQRLLEVFEFEHIRDHTLGLDLSAVEVRNSAREAERLRERSDDLRQTHA